MTSHLSGMSLCDRIRALCADTLDVLPPGPAMEAVAAVRDRLAGRTLRIAVGGRVNAGKSTLVNALLGQRLAATGATETTTLVTWYRHHHQNRVRLALRSGGETLVASAPGGGVPATLPVPVADIEAVVVETPNARLADRYQLVDTPGLDSVSGLDEPAMAALAQADALLYVMPHPGDRDREALESLRATSGRAGLSAANVLGVLSRVDTLSDDDDPWPHAWRTAGGYAIELRGLVAGVVPVVGLLAETAVGDTVTEDDLRRLRLLAEADAEDDVLYSPAALLGADLPGMSGEDRRRLLRLFGMYGLREAARLRDAGVTRSDEMLRSLTASSGIASVTRFIEESFVRSADRLRGVTAITLLERAAWLGDGPEQRHLRARLNELRNHPVMRQAALAPALRDLADGRLTLDEEHADALIRLATGGTDTARLGLPDQAEPAEVAAVADRWTARWRRLEGSPSRLLARHARSARELSEIAFFASRPNS
ncbi:dynamin family protein [Actinoplanes lobatus]|uniref:Dynamin N-terminal domain-containing protein n=1 Tax=Actinoplanes lobatus TaxID=113568 RepID=A0A7W7HQF3_9ACTN|nr:dynamin family protein [Actinoplanes lobatus]MBB4754552.1 hypothetical protein [Actinoplanes lobatus]